MTGLFDQPLDDASALAVRVYSVHEAAARAEEQSLSDPPSGAGLLGLAVRAKRLYDERRRRAAVFGSDDVLFGEPAWDILLDLFMAWSDRRTVRIGDACIAAAVPKTTALRWLETLTERRLVERTSDRSDARSGIVCLTTRGIEVMTTYLGQLA